MIKDKKKIGQSCSETGMLGKVTKLRAVAECAGASKGRAIT